MKKVLLFLITSFLVVFFIIGIFIYFLNISPGESDNIFIFKVKKGWGVKKIALELKNSNIIRSDRLLVLISYIMNSHKSFKEGTYSLSGNLSTIEVYKKLIKGQVPYDIQVVIPEGYTIRRIAKKLKNNNIIFNEDEFIALTKDKEFITNIGLPYNSLEGFLFPDTYKFYMEMQSRDIIKIMVDNFFSKLKDIGISYKDFDFKEFYNNIILASIVEREYKNDFEAPKIASVFINRINFNMALQSCGTIEYIITEKLLKPHPKRIFFKDLKIKSDYNTYLHNGYPPTPISNAGKIALKAAFFPEKTNCLFFVVDNPKLGTHKFSSNYSDHLINSSNYLKNFVTKD